MATLKIRKTIKTKTQLKYVSSWHELFQLANSGDERYQKLIICALSNLGQEPRDTYHPSSKDPKWLRCYYGLQEYITALCCEYGESETKAEREVLAEVNNVRDCIDQVTLN